MRFCYIILTSKFCSLSVSLSCLISRAVIFHLDNAMVCKLGKDMITLKAKLKVKDGNLLSGDMHNLCSSPIGFKSKSFIKKDSFKKDIIADIVMS